MTKKIKQVTMHCNLLISAIEMAQQVVDSGNDATLRKFAKKILEDQSREIKELQHWLKEQH